MKQVIFTLSGAMLCALIFVALLSVDARAIREKELKTAVSAAAAEAVREVHTANYNHRLTDDELIALFEQLLFARIGVSGGADGAGDPNFSLKVDIAGADASKGLLFVHVEETFTYPNGKTGTIEDTAQLLIEQEALPEMITVTYMHTDAAILQSEKNGSTVLPKIIKVYQVEKGQTAPTPSGDWVLSSCDANGNRTYIPRAESLSVDGEVIIDIEERSQNNEVHSLDNTQDSDELPLDATPHIEDTISENILYGEDLPDPDTPSSERPADSVAEAPSETSTALSSLIEEIDATDSPEARDILVAVIDTGIDLSLQDNPNSPLYGRISEYADPSLTDPDGHGTAMASIIAENTPARVKLLPIKAFDDNGNGTIEASCEAVEAALAAEADIINLSFTGIGVSEDMRALIQQAVARGCTVITAAGNKSSDVTDFVPANIEEAVTISAVREDLTFAPYSNYGSSIDFAADGLARLAGDPEDPSDDIAYAGTSVSAAFASAYAALLLTAAPSTDVDIYGSFLASAKDLGEPGRDDLYGNGYLSADNLIRIAKEFHEAEESDAPEPPMVPIAFADSGIQMSRAAFSIKTMTYSTTTPIRLEDLGAGAKIRLAWDNSSGFNRNGGASVSCNGTVSTGANYIDAVSNDGNFSITLNNFNFSRNGNLAMSQAIIVSVTPGTKRGYVYSYCRRDTQTTAAYSYTMNPVNIEYLYSPINGYNLVDKAAGSIIFEQQPYASWLSCEEQTVIHSRVNSSTGCTLMIAPCQRGLYFPRFYGVWDSKSTTINYRGNGGTTSGSASNKINDGYYTEYRYSTGDNYRYFTKTATRDGYLFTGWNTKADGSGTSFPEGFDVKEYTANHPEKDATLNIYAQWRSAAYKVHFNATPTSVQKNNCNNCPYSTEPKGSMADQTLTFNKSQALSENTFTRSGYQFYGWTTSPTSHTPLYYNRATVENLVSPNSGKTEITLYAVWSPITYKIRYKANGVNSGTAADQTVAYDSPISLYANPFYEEVNGKRSSSFIFNCYHTSSNAKSSMTFGIRSEVRNSNSPLSDTPKCSWQSGEKVYNLTDKKDRIISLYAIWDIDYTLVLSANLGTGETSRTDLYNKTAYPYRQPDYGALVYPHIGTMSGHSQGAANPYFYTAFRLPRGYPFIKEKKVTAASCSYYDVNTESYTDHTYRYSQQGWAWSTSTSYQSANYAQEEYLTSAASQRKSPGNTTMHYAKWLDAAVRVHPSNVTADASGYLTVTLYAVWDEAPEIDAYDRYFTADELKSYLDSDTLPDVLAGSDYLRITDREDRQLSNGTRNGCLHRNGTNALSIDLDPAELRSLLSSGGSRFATSVSFTATDAVGNTTTRSILIHVTSDTPVLSMDPSGGYAASFVRAISRGNYSKHGGSSEATDITANENGALKAHSLWYDNAAYVKTVTDAFSVSEAAGGYVYSKRFDLEAIRAAQSDINKNGIGFTRADPGRLQRWMEVYYR